MSSWMAVPCWSQREKTETNEERQEGKRRGRWKRIEERIPVGRFQLRLSV